VKEGAVVIVAGEPRADGVWTVESVAPTGTASQTLVLKDSAPIPATPPTVPGAIAILPPEVGDAPSPQGPTLLANVLPGASPATSDKPPQVNFTRTFTVETLYRGAFRLGVGGSFSPWAQDLVVATNAAGLKYAQLGPRDGAPGLEVLAGYSVFLCVQHQECWGRGGGGEMSDMHPSWGLAANASLGTFKYAAAGLAGLSSLRAGLELAYGLDFSVSALAGINRHDAPAAGFQAGALLPGGAATINTRFAVTPGFGVVINLPSSMLTFLNIKGGG